VKFKPEMTGWTDGPLLNHLIQVKWPEQRGLIISLSARVSCIGL
jgi:hypothetical protein